MAFLNSVWFGSLFSIGWLLFLVGCSAQCVAAAPVDRQPHPPILRWLGPDSALALTAGATPASVIVAESGAVGDRFTRVVEADEAACLLVMARGSEKITDVDLYAYSEDGSVLGVDDRSDARPTLILCPPHPRHIYVTARIANGQGMVAVGVHTVPPDRARRVEVVLHAVQQRSGPADVPEATIIDVERRLDSHLRSLGGRWTSIAQTSLATDSRIPTVTGVMVDARSCVDALVLSPLTLYGLDVEVLDDSGRTVGRSNSAEQDKWLIVCAEERRAFSLRLRPHEGSGTVLVLISRGSLQAGRSTDRAIELSQTLAQEGLVENVHAGFRARKLSLGQKIAQWTLTSGEQQRVETSVGPGCTRFDVFAGAPSLNVQARAYSGEGNLISMSSGSQYLPLFVCAPGKLVLVVEAQTSGGPLQIEKSQTSVVSSAMSGNPRAAARIFSWAWQLGLLLDFTDFTDVRSVPFSTKAIWEHELALHSGQCTEVFAALEDDVGGIRLNQVDSTTGELNAGEAAPSAAHLRVCCARTQVDCKYRVQVDTRGTSATALFATADLP
jgi:hypothetical protein